MNYLELHDGLGGMRELNYLQAENQMKTFSQMTGGYAWFPQFDGEMPGIFHEVTAYLRHQYSLSYTPTNGATPTANIRKVKVELVRLRMAARWSSRTKRAKNRSGWFTRARATPLPRAASATEP